jgi:hypothetical protein
MDLGSFGPKISRSTISLAQWEHEPLEIVLALQATPINFLHHEIHPEDLLGDDDQSMDVVEEGLGLSQNQLNPLLADPMVSEPIPQNPTLDNSEEENQSDNFSSANL